MWYMISIPLLKMSKWVSMEVNPNFANYCKKMEPHAVMMHRDEIFEEGVGLKALVDKLQTETNRLKQMHAARMMWMCVCRAII